MLFRTIYLDSLYRDSLERIATDAGWITSDYEGDAVTSTLAGAQADNRLRRKTLLLLTLFESIDSNATGMDVSRLVDEGIILDDATMFQAMPRQFFSDTLAGNDLPLVQLSRATARSLMVTFKERIIQRHCALYPDRYDGTIYNYGSRGTLSTVFDSFLDDPQQTFDYWPHLGDFIGGLEVMQANFQECIFFSAKHSHPFASPFSVTPAIEPRATELIDDVYCVARTKLTDEIVFLPNPKTLDDALFMRDKKEMRRFRTVMQAWCDTLAAGKPAAEIRMREDIRKANKELRRLREWKEYESSPFNFVLNSVGGHIPVLSSILTLLSTVTGLWRFRVEKKHNWVMLGDIRSTRGPKR